MSLPPPSPSSGRGRVVLQPEYFTSSLYVQNLRRDISSLLGSYRDHYSHSSQPPFALFKQIWLSHRWQWLLFKVFDSRSRHTFLTVTLRLFLERTAPVEDPLTRAAALFGFYTFFYSQPKDTAPPLYSVSHIPIPIDHHSSLKELPNLLTSQPLRPHVVIVLTMLVKDGVFYILPNAVLSADNPRELPREEVIEEDMAEPPSETGKRKRGRPSKRDKAKRNAEAFDQLERWLKKSRDTSSVDPELDHYQEQKRQVLDALLATEGGSDVIQRASAVVVEGLRRAREMVEGDIAEGEAGLKRAEGGDGEGSGGLLRLLGGRLT